MPLTLPGMRRNALNNSNSKTIVSDVRLNKEVALRQSWALSGFMKEVSTTLKYLSTRANYSKLASPDPITLL